MAPVTVAYPNSDHRAAAFEMKLSSFQPPPFPTQQWRSAYQQLEGIISVVHKNINILILILIIFKIMPQIKGNSLFETQL